MTALMSTPSGHYVAYRVDRDGQTGPESIWENAIEPLNTILNPEWAPFSYGSIERRPGPYEYPGAFSYGFGDCQGEMGKIISSHILLDWKKYPGENRSLTTVAIDQKSANAGQEFLRLLLPKMAAFLDHDQFHLGSG
jgi:hypothetical protein